MTLYRSDTCLGEKRLKIFLVSWELLRQMFTPGEHAEHYRVLSAAVPADAQCESVCESRDYPGLLEITISSATFPEVRQGPMLGGNI